MLGEDKVLRDFFLFCFLFLFPRESQSESMLGENKVLSGFFVFVFSFFPQFESMLGEDKLSETDDKLRSLDQLRSLLQVRAASVFVLLRFCTSEASKAQTTRCGR
jgi:hypothetical protein